MFTFSERSLQYLEPDARMTLREGLEEYHDSIQGLVDPGELAGDAATLFRHHDACHVVFACDTSIPQEAQVDTWTLFGTDVGVATYLAYLKTPEARGVVVEAGVWRSLWQSLLAVPDCWRVFVRTRRMTRRWPWSEYARHLDEPLVELRRAYGIEVLPQSVSVGRRLPAA